MTNRRVATRPCHRPRLLAASTRSPHRILRLVSLRVELPGTTLQILSLVSLRAWELLGTTLQVLSLVSLSVAPPSSPRRVLNSANLRVKLPNSVRRTLRSFRTQHPCGAMTRTGTTTPFRRQRLHSLPRSEIPRLAHRSPRRSPAPSPGTPMKAGMTSQERHPRAICLKKIHLRRWILVFSKTTMGLPLPLPSPWRTLPTGLTTRTGTTTEPRRLLHGIFRVQ